MIRLENRPPTPGSLKSPAVEETKREIANKVKAGIPLQSRDFKAIHWRKEDVKKTIWEYQHKKCCYCERKRDLKREFDVEHFRPKTGVADEPKHPGYWWLAYRWENYFFACKSCNEDFKKSHFPLLPGGKRAFSDTDDLKAEQPVLIHPLDENPEKFIGFEWEDGYNVLVRAVGLDKSGRGARTAVQLTAINLKEVMEERGELLSLLKALANDLKKMLEEAEITDNKELKSNIAWIVKEETAPRRQFSGFRRAFFRSAGLGEFVHNSA
jgi:uncharacterized protein (TIGR02646 family)